MGKQGALCGVGGAVWAGCAILHATPCFQGLNLIFLQL